MQNLIQCLLEIQPIYRDKMAGLGGFDCSHARLVRLHQGLVAKGKALSLGVNFLEVLAFPVVELLVFECERVQGDLFVFYLSHLRVLTPLVGQCLIIAINRAFRVAIKFRKAPSHCVSSRDGLRTLGQGYLTRRIEPNLLCNSAFRLRMFFVLVWLDAFKLAEHALPDHVGVAGLVVSVSFPQLFFSEQPLVSAFRVVHGLQRIHLVKAFLGLNLALPVSVAEPVVPMHGLCFG